MNSGYEITMFGEFTISNGTEIITDQANRSKKVWTLLEYLIVHRDRSVTQKELVDLLWPGNDTKDPINTLKVLMHRVRSLLDELGKDSGKKMIYYKSGAYGWNSELNCVVDTEKFEAALKKADVEELVGKLPQGLNTKLFKVLDENGVDLSGGEKQRISLARATLRKSDILLLDEYTSNLNKDMENEIENFILNQKDKTVIVVTHQINKEKLKKFDVILELKNGKIKEVPFFI